MSIAYWVHDLGPFIVQFGGNFGIRWYGAAYVAAFLLGYWLFLRLSRMGLTGVAPERVGDMIAGCALFGVLLGGRLGYMLFYDFGNFLREPWILFRIWDGGMSSHGGVLGIVVFTYIYARRNRMSWTGLGDGLVVVAPIGLFLGRVANFINGELYGRVGEVPWAVRFPKALYEAGQARLADAMHAAMGVDPGLQTLGGVVDASYERGEVREAIAPFLHPRHPSQLYEALFEGLVLFAILLAVRLRWKTLRHGVLTGLFFILYAVFRIGVECFREPDAALTLGMTRGQFLSLFMILVGVLFLVFGGRGRVEKQEG